MILECVFPWTYRKSTNDVVRTLSCIPPHKGGPTIFVSFLNGPVSVRYSLPYLLGSVCEVRVPGDEKLSEKPRMCFCVHGTRVLRVDNELVDEDSHTGNPL